MADDVAERAVTWLQAVWAQRAADALAQAGALPEPDSRATSAVLRARLARVPGSDALSEARDALDDVLAIAQMRESPRGDVSAVLEAVRHPMLLTRADRRLVDANDAASALLGVAREELRQRRVDDFVVERWRGAFAARWASLEAGATASGALLLRLRSDREITVGYTAAVGLAQDRHLMVVERVDGVRFRRWAEGTARRDAGPVLRPREREILALVAAGRTSAGIARQLDLSRNTVESHIRNAVVRLGASNRTHAVVRALGLGEIRAPVTRDEP